MNLGANMYADSQSPGKARSHVDVLAAIGRLTEHSLGRFRAARPSSGSAASRVRPLAPGPRRVGPGAVESVGRPFRLFVRRPYYAVTGRHFVMAAPCSCRNLFPRRVSPVGCHVRFRQLVQIKVANEAIENSLLLPGSQDPPSENGDPKNPKDPYEHTSTGVAKRPHIVQNKTANSPKHHSKSDGNKQLSKKSGTL